MSQLPTTPSVHRNKLPILEVLQNYIIDTSPKQLLEVGSGTGEHAVFFAKNFPHLLWQTSDTDLNHEVINIYIENSLSKNILSPLYYQAGNPHSISKKYDFIFTANTLHIMSWENCETLFSDINNLLKKDGLLFIYGPFKYQNQFTSESNENFEQWLKSRTPHSGVRDFERVLSRLQQYSIELIRDHNMPANNQFLIFQKTN